MNLKPYQEFQDAVTKFKLIIDTEGYGSLCDRKTKQFNEKTKDKNPELYDEQKTRFIRNLNHASVWQEKSKVYEVDDKIKKICAFSKVPKNTDKFAFLPFDNVFIDVDFSDDEYPIKDKKIVGILLGRSPLVTGDVKKYNEWTKDKDSQLADEIFKVGDAINALVIVQNEDTTILDSCTFAHKTDKKYDDFKIQTKNVPSSSFVRKFVLNFLNFLNDPDVVTVTRKRNREKRKKQGKMPLPDSEYVRVTGRLLKYIDSESNKSGWHYSFRFPVRSHLRRYRNNDGEVVREVKIPSFFKGSGVTVDNKYKVVASKKHSKVKEYDQENLDYDEIKPLKKPMRQTRYRTK